MGINKSMFRRPLNTLEGGTRREDTPPGGEEILACPACKHGGTRGELGQSAWVCPSCGHHYPLCARARIELIADDNTFAERGGELTAKDFIGFPGYAKKLEQAREQSGEGEAVVTGFARIAGMETGIFAMEAGFMMGSLGSMTGERLARLFEEAAQKRLPVIGFTVSGGARVQEGMLALMQMAKVSGAVLSHSNAGQLYVCVLCHPTTGGVTASFAMQGDITLAEPGALIGFAGPRVIKQTMRQKLPEGFQRAEFLRQKGFVDAIVPRGTQRQYLANLLKLHGRETV